MSHMYGYQGTQIHIYARFKVRSTGNLVDRLHGLRDGGKQIMNSNMKTRCHYQ